LVIEIDVRRSLAIEIDQLTGGKDQRSTEFQQPVIGKGLDDQFRSDPIQIADSNPDHRSLVLNAHALKLI
jgi:hypothetical protein